MDWQTFLTARICVRYGLTKREREILQVKFPDEKTVKDNQQVAQQITNKSKDQASVDPDTVRKQLHTIYNKRFCPKENREHFPSYNDNGSKAKDEKFSAWLKQQYEYWLEEQGFKLPTNAVTAISDNPFVPLSDIIEDMSLLFGREREIRRIFETLSGHFRGRVYSSSPNELAKGIGVATSKSHPASVASPRVSADSYYTTGFE